MIIYLFATMPVMHAHSVTQFVLELGCERERIQSENTLGSLLFKGHNNYASDSGAKNGRK